MPQSKKRVRPTSESGDKEWSLKWVALVLIVLIAAFCWSLGAASYAHNRLGWRTGSFEGGDAGEMQMGYRGRGALADFLSNSVEQLNAAPQVIGYCVSEAWWVIIVFSVLEGLAILFWIKARAIEKELAG
jgi:hypothetical protein